MAKDKITLSIEPDLNDWLEAHPEINASGILARAVREELARYNQAVDVVYTRGDVYARMTKATDIIQMGYFSTEVGKTNVRVRTGPHDDFEHRQVAHRLADTQSRLLKEIWPDVQFHPRDLHLTARRELKLPNLPIDNPEESKNHA